MRYAVLTLAVLLLLYTVFADTYTSAVQVAVQDNPYDLQTIIGSASVGSQDTAYDMQTITGSAGIGSQDTVYDLQTVATSVVIFDQNATIPVVDYSATYNPDTNQTTVSVSVTSDPVPTYYVFIYDPAGNLLKSYATSNANSTTTLDGQYSALYIVVIANSIGVGGSLDLGVYPAFVVGTNIVPVKVVSVGQYNINVYGGYAISPVYVGDINKPVYIIATAKVVKVTVSQ